MSNELVVNNEHFLMQDCGGDGACLFRCLAKVMGSDSHRTVRRNIVNYVIENWETYRDWVKFSLRVKTQEEYRSLMSPATSYGSDIECRAASEFYQKQIILIRKLNNEYFTQTYGDRGNHSVPVYLLFTGMRHENDLDGHYQLLRKQNNISTSEENIEVSKPMLGDITNTLTAVKKIKTKSGVKSLSFNENLSGKKRKCLTKDIKEIIIRVRNFLQESKENLDINIVPLTAEILNVSETTVIRVTSDFKKNNGILEEHNCYNSGRKSIVLDDFYCNIIRTTIFDMYMDKEFPTVKKVLARLKEIDENFPNISEYVLLKTLKRMNFQYKKLNKKPILMENWTIAGHRAEYLRKIEYYRKNGWKIFYTDETWCGANHSRKFGWVQEVDPNQSFDNYDHYRKGVQSFGGYRGGFITPSGAGKRVIILHIGSEDGFLKNGLNCFIGLKGSADYHNEMNAEHYKEWFRKIIMDLPEKSIIVIDQAPYHTMIHPNFKNPTTKWLKADLIKWMKNQNIKLPAEVESFQELTKPSLLLLCKPHHLKKIYLLEMIASELRGDEVKILWLPVAHCEFNPIELIWAYVKNKVAAENKTFKIKDVHELCIQTINNIPENLWKNCVKHAMKFEEQYRKGESQLADAIEPIIINTNDSSDSEISTDEDL